MIAEILCVGTELLLGDIVNTNAAYIAKELAALGIDVYHQSVVGDNAKRLADSLALAFLRSDIVILTGGLGPTYDDLTKETVAEYFRLPLETDEETKKSIYDYFARRGLTPTKNNDKQALVPKGAVIFKNYAGTAPGMAVSGRGKIAVLLPGPPYEMTTMFETGVRAYLSEFSDHVLFSRTLHLSGIGESAVEYELRELMEKTLNPTIAPYAKTGEVQIRLTASAKTREEADQLIEPYLKMISEKFAPYVIGADVKDPESGAVMLLLEKGLTLAVAESCTGGLLSKRVTDVPGSSGMFLLGVTAYANEMKTRVLGVPSALISEKGAVSQEVAAEMAKGARRVSGADIGVGITGVAGPGGGTPEKPVGTIYIAVDSDVLSKVVKYDSIHPGYDREQLRFRATQEALRLIVEAARQS